MEHEQVVRWRAMDNQLHLEYGWPEEIRERYGDLEERIKGQIIFEKNDWKTGWVPPISKQKQKELHYVVNVKSQSQKNVMREVNLKLILSTDDKYILTSVEHSCPDTIYQRGIYKKKPRIIGPDQHVFAAIYAAQKNLSKDLKQVYGMWPKEFVNFYNKLDKYFSNKGDYTSILRKKITYILNDILYSSNPSINILRKFKNQKIHIISDTGKYEVYIIATPLTTLRSKKTLIEVQFGRNNIFFKVQGLNYKTILDNQTKNSSKSE